MRFINDGLVIRRIGSCVIFPVVSGVDDHTFRKVRCIIGFADGQIFIRRSGFHIVPEKCIIPPDCSCDGLRIRIYQNFMGIETMSIMWFKRSFYAVSIQLTGFYSGQIGMPDMVRAFLKLYIDGFAGVYLAKQAKFYTSSVVGVQGKIHSFSIPGGSKRVGFSGIYFYWHLRISEYLFKQKN